MNKKYHVNFNLINIYMVFFIITPTNPTEWTLHMAVLRIQKKQKNFVILDKTCLNDKTLSWGAKGLHAYLMSLPDDWRVRVSDLQLRSKNGRDAVRGLLKELEQAGYIQAITCRNESSGRFGGIEYFVVETPEPEKPSLVINEQFYPEPDNQSPENPATGNPGCAPGMAQI